MAWVTCCTRRAARSRRVDRAADGSRSRGAVPTAAQTGWARLSEVVIASDAKALIEALVRRSGGDPMTGVVLLEHPALLRELERWVWVWSHSGNAHHNQMDRIAYRMASEGRESVAVASSSSLALAPWFTSQAPGSSPCQHGSLLPVSIYPQGQPSRKEITGLLQKLDIWVK